MFLKISQISPVNTCARVSFLIKLQGSGLQLYQKETLVKEFSSEFYEIFNNTFFTEQLRTTTSGISYKAPKHRKCFSSPWKGQ